jgi:glycopeptide antibiotics resistance protein
VKVKKLREPAALSIYLLFLFLIVWSPVSEESEAILGIFRFGGIFEKILNLLLLLPLPFLIMRSFNTIPLRFLVFCGPSLSILIEVVQKLIPGRVSDPLDFTLNSIGYLLCLFSLRRTKRLSVKYR